MAESSSSSSSCSKRVQQVVLVLLLLWSVVSLVVIVVWSTSPDLKGSAHCRAQLAQRTEQQQEAQERWSKDKEALEEKVLEQQQETLRLGLEVQQLLAQFNQTKEELQECQQEQVVLKRNISDLLLEVQLLEQTKENLTQQLRLQEEETEALQQNLTQSLHSYAACLSHKVALQSQKEAAESETRGCRSSEEFMRRQLLKCKQADTHQQSQQSGSTPCPTSSGAAPPPSMLLLMLLLPCVSHLILTCECKHGGGASAAP